MRRPFADKRPIGPFFGQEGKIPDEEMEILSVKRDCKPKIIVDVNSEAGQSGVGLQGMGVTDVFKMIDDRARFEVDDVVVETVEGEIGTFEPLKDRIVIFTDEEEIPLEDINHIVGVLENKFSVVRSDISGYRDVDLDDIEEDTISLTDMV